MDVVIKTCELQILIPKLNPTQNQRGKESIGECKQAILTQSNQKHECEEAKTNVSTWQTLSPRKAWETK